MLAVFGVVCIVLTAVAFIGHYSLIMFKTGSMSPAIPPGSLAVVHEIPATEVQLGDVITVDRGKGKAPITHRVIELQPLGGGEVAITMRGDANPYADPAPYRVTHVRKVLWHAPELAKQVVWLSNPYTLGGITATMSLLVLWAFWPHRARTPRKHRR